VELAIRRRLTLPDFRPGKVSVWIKLIRYSQLDGGLVEETVGNIHKLMLAVNSSDELMQELSANMVVSVYGGEMQLVKEMPNLIVKLFDRKAYVEMPGAPPVDQAGQLVLKATVYRWEPSLWDQLLGKA